MEKECCSAKKTVRSEAEKKTINNRLNRIEGQIKGIKKMVAEDRYCNDILIQLSAIESSVKSLSMHILENNLYSCLPRRAGGTSLLPVADIPPAVCLLRPSHRPYLPRCIPL